MISYTLNRLMRQSVFFVALFFRLIVHAQTDSNTLLDQHRPQFHFTPQAHWMNDPNGLVYYKGEYHLFFQHYPDSTVWGPMHWGHAISTDLIHWKQLPIALYPDSIGLIFSGSVVVDSLNTSGFKDSTKGESPLVAVFTYHNMAREKLNTFDFQTQGIAYSNDKGRTWEKYVNNPVLKNTTQKDFRDPKVFWFDAEKKWVMTLAVGDHVEFYASINLKEWIKTGEFGKTEGAHGGVWECPDLFQITMSNELLDFSDQTAKKLKADESKLTATKWILIQSIGRGAPNGGSGTQYFVGEFDGKSFKNDNAPQTNLWLDYGCDDYAAVTFNNVPHKNPIMMGWMSNWLYATEVPTEKWRSAMTVPRELTLHETREGLRLFQRPIKEFKNLHGEVKKYNLLSVNDTLSIAQNSKLNDLSVEIDLAKSKSKSFSVLLCNRVGEEVEIGYNAESNTYFIDRTRSGKTKFNKDFSSVALAPRVSNKKILKIRIVQDVASVEVFCDDGETVLTDIFFPTEDFNAVKLIPKSNGLFLREAKVYNLKR